MPPVVATEGKMPGLAWPVVERGAFRIVMRMFRPRDVDFWMVAVLRALTPGISVGGKVGTT